MNLQSLLEDISDVSDSIRVAERIQKELQYAFNLSGYEVFATASIGIAPGSSAYERAEDILRDADTAMYRAKALGRARHQVFDKAMHARAVAFCNLKPIYVAQLNEMNSVFIINLSFPFKLDKCMALKL